MYYHILNYESLGIYRGKCPICGEISNIKISRGKHFNIWLIFLHQTHEDPFGTCGSCHNSFKLDKEWVFQYLDFQGVKYRKSFATLNKITLSAPVAVILGVPILVFILIGLSWLSQNTPILIPIFIGIAVIACALILIVRNGR